MAGQFQTYVSLLLLVPVPLVLIRTVLQLIPPPPFLSFSLSIRLIELITQNRSFTNLMDPHLHSRPLLHHLLLANLIR